jgi:lysozyme
MQYTGLKFTEGFENCKLTAYYDIKGVLTIGWGHCGPDVYEGLVWTQAQADAHLQLDMGKAVSAVNDLVKVTITQNEFNAICDFTYNCGCHAFATSTLLAKLNAGDLHGAAAEFQRWDKADGKVVAGLLRRRLAEEKLFNT